MSVLRRLARRCCWRRAPRARCSFRSRRRIPAALGPRLAKEHLSAPPPCVEDGLVLLLDGGEEEASEEGRVELVGMGFLEEADELLGMLGLELDLLLAQGGEFAPDIPDGGHGWCAPEVSASLG
jgi:hypothetical protein